MIIRDFRAKSFDIDEIIYKMHVYIISSNVDIITSISNQLQQHNYEFSVFSSAQQFLDNYSAFLPECVIINTEIGGVDGLALQQKLLAKRYILPIIFLSKTATIDIAVTAIRHGAIDFLTFPVNKDKFLQVMTVSAIQVQHNRKLQKYHDDIFSKFNSLSKREKEIFYAVTDGIVNKDIAKRLNISIRTVEAHRYTIMKKMQATSLATLIKQALLLAISLPLKQSTVLNKMFRYLCTN